MGSGFAREIHKESITRFEYLLCTPPSQSCKLGLFRHAGLRRFSRVTGTSEFENY